MFKMNVFVSFHQKTPLHKAVEKGHVSTVKCLVEEGADIHSKDKLGVSESYDYPDHGLIF